MYLNMFLFMRSYDFILYNCNKITKKILHNVRKHCISAVEKKSSITTVTDRCDAGNYGKNMSVYTTKDFAPSLRHTAQALNVFYSINVYRRVFLRL